MSTLHAHENIASDTSTSLPLEPQKNAALTICSLIARGLGLEDACAALSPPIDPSVFWNWRCADPAIADAYTQATAARMHLIAGEIIACHCKPVATIEGRDGSRRVDPAAVAQRKHEVETMKWAASRLLREDYGDKTEVATKVVVGHLTPEEIREKTVRALERLYPMALDQSPAAGQIR